MNSKLEGIRKVEISMHFSEFEMPPMQDILVVGRKAPIGPEAAKRMVNVISPDQYEIIRLENPIVEALVIRRSLLNMVPKDKLVAIIMEEAEKIANDSMIVKAQVDITLHVSKSIDL